MCYTYLHRNFVRNNFLGNVGYNCRHLEQHIEIAYITVIVYRMMYENNDIVHLILSTL